MSLKFPVHQPAAENQGFVGYRWKNEENRGYGSLLFGFLLICADINRRDGRTRKLLNSFNPEQSP